MKCHGTVFRGDANAGVSCESCHGPSSGYNDVHQEKGSYAKAIAAGLRDLKNKPAAIAKVCVDCHVTPDKRLAAAGHPAGEAFDAGVSLAEDRPLGHRVQLRAGDGGREGGSRGARAHGRRDAARGRWRSRRGGGPGRRIAGRRGGREGGSGRCRPGACGGRRPHRRPAERPPRPRRPRRGTGTSRSARCPPTTCPSRCRGATPAAAAAERGRRGRAAARAEPAVPPSLAERPPLPRDLTAGARCRRPPPRRRRRPAPDHGAGDRGKRAARDALLLDKLLRAGARDARRCPGPVEARGVQGPRRRAAAAAGRGPGPRPRGAAEAGVSTSVDEAAAARALRAPHAAHGAGGARVPPRPAALLGHPREGPREGHREGAEVPPRRRVRSPATSCSARATTATPRSTSWTARSRSSSRRRRTTRRPRSRRCGAAPTCRPAAAPGARPGVGGHDRPGAAARRHRDPLRVPGRDRARRPHSPRSGRDLRRDQRALALSGLGQRASPTRRSASCRSGCPACGCSSAASKEFKKFLDTRYRERTLARHLRSVDALRRRGRRASSRRSRRRPSWSRSSPAR